MPADKQEAPPHTIPLSEYPKVGDIIRCTDDNDLGIVISTNVIGPYGKNPKVDLYVEVQWQEAGLCTDGWNARSFNTYNSLYEIVSRV